MKKKKLVTTLALSGALSAVILFSAEYKLLGSGVTRKIFFDSTIPEPSKLEVMCKPNIDSLKQEMFSPTFVWDEHTYPAFNHLIDDTVFGGYSLSNTDFNKFHVLTKNGKKIATEIDSLGGNDFAQLLGVKVGEVGSINDLFTNLQEFNDLYARIAREEGVERRLLLAIASQESRFNPYAISTADCLGLQQLHPSVYQDNNPFVLEENVRESARLLRYLQRAYDGNDTLALTAYNRGMHGLNQVIREANNHDVFATADILQFQKNSKYLLSKEAREYADKVLLYKELIRLYQPSHGPDRFLALYRSLKKEREEKNS